MQSDLAYTSHARSRGRVRRLLLSHQHDAWRAGHDSNCKNKRGCRGTHCKDSGEFEHIAIITACGADLTSRLSPCAVEAFVDRATASRSDDQGQPRTIHITICSTVNFHYLLRLPKPPDQLPLPSDRPYLHLPPYPCGYAANTADRDRDSEELAPLWLVSRNCDVSGRPVGLIEMVGRKDVQRKRDKCSVTRISVIREYNICNGKAY